MTAFLKYLWLQLKLDLRDRGTLLNFYLVPLLFYFVVGAVFTSVNPLMKTTLAASMTVFAVTMGAFMGFPTPIVRMRESGTLRAFKVNGIPGVAVLSVHTLSAFIHLLIVSAVIYVTSPLIFHSTIPANPWLYAAVLVLLVFVSVAIGLLIGVSARSQSTATMFSMIVFLPSLLLSGVMFPSSMLPKALRWIGRIFPATHVLTAFFGLAYQNHNVTSAGLSLTVVICMGVIVCALVIWQFRKITTTEQW